MYCLWLEIQFQVSLSSFNFMFQSQVLVSSFNFELEFQVSVSCFKFQVLIQIRFMFKFLFKLKFLGFVEAPVGVFFWFLYCIYNIHIPPPNRGYTAISGLKIQFTIIKSSLYFFVWLSFHSLLVSNLTELIRLFPIIAKLSPNPNWGLS